jgi:uncharacterized protein (DUF1330 family)
MTAYVIAAETVKAETMFDEYRKQVPATLAPFGGKFIVRGGKVTVHEGAWPHPRTVVIEFPSRARAEGWYRSADYQRSSSSGTRVPPAP